MSTGLLDLDHSSAACTCAWWAPGRWNWASSSHSCVAKVGSGCQTSAMGGSCASYHRNGSMVQVSYKVEIELVSRHKTLLSATAHNHTGLYP